MIKQIINNKILNAPYAPQGLIYGVGIDSGIEKNYCDVVRFQHAPSASSNDAFDFQTFVDGNVSEYIEKESSKISSVVMTNENAFNFNVLPVIESFPTSTFFYCLPIGDRIKITVEENTDDADFYSYLLFWDAGLGGAFTEYAENIGRKNNTFAIEDLAAGTYKIKIKTKDKVGNVSNYSSQIILQVQLYEEPLNYDDIDISWSESSRTITITGGAPDGQTSQLQGAKIYSNFYADLGADALLTGVVGGFDKAFEVVALDDDEDLSYETRKLFAGIWCLRIATFTKYNVESEPSDFWFRLYLDGTTLKYSEYVLPNTPTDITATAQADAGIQIVVSYTYQAGEVIHLYENGILIDSVLSDEDGATVWDLAARTDGDEYEYYATASRSDDPNNIESEPTYTVKAIADGTPPEISEITRWEIVR